MELGQKYKRIDGSIDLVRVFTRDYTQRLSSVAEDFLEDVEIWHPIRSRQSAAIALATAEFIARLKMNNPLPDH